MTLGSPSSGVSWRFVGGRHNLGLAPRLISAFLLYKQTCMVKKARQSHARSWSICPVSDPWWSHCNFPGSFSKNFIHSQIASWKVAINFTYVIVSQVKARLGQAWQVINKMPSSEGGSVYLNFLSLLFLFILSRKSPQLCKRVF